MSNIQISKVNGLKLETITKSTERSFTNGATRPLFPIKNLGVKRTLNDEVVTGRGVIFC